MKRKQIQWKPSIQSLKEIDYLLLVPLMLILMLPAIQNLLRINWLEDVEQLNILGHIEWFDLFDETIKAFLLIPLYFILHTGIKKYHLPFKESFTKIFISNSFIYILAMSFILFEMDTIVDKMNVLQNQQEVIFYLSMESFALLLSLLIQMMFIGYVIIGKKGFFYVLLTSKIALGIIADVFLVTSYGAIGGAVSSIIINLLLFIILVVYDTLPKNRFLFSFKKTEASYSKLIKLYTKVGLFAGVTILLANIGYISFVMPMITSNDWQGFYWGANEVIWGMLLVPILALESLIQKDSEQGIETIRLTPYVTFFLAWFVGTMLLVVLLYTTNFYLPKESLYIILISYPFYFAFGGTVILDGVLKGIGRTQELLQIEIIVLCGYYLSIYYFYLSKVEFVPIENIAIIFGSGMVLHLLLSMFQYNKVYKQHTLLIDKEVK